jgi:DNA-binding IclR family transcriptional regulator
MNSEGVGAVNRALEVLEVFNERDGMLTLAELSTRTGMYKSTILRLIESLEKFGYIQKTSEGAYRLGSKPLYLGSIYQRHFNTAQFVPQVLKRLAEEVNETASFYIREGETRVCLHRHEASRAVRASVHQGDRFPMNAGAAGHVILAFSGLSGEKYDRIRASMYAISIGERDPDTSAIASPVLGVGDSLVGVLNISVPVFRLERTSLESFLPSLFKYATELTELCGGSNNVFKRVSVDAA